MGELKGLKFGEFHILAMPELKSEMTINDGLKIQFQRVIPCWFHRKMQKLFFGFEWRRI